MPPGEETCHDPEPQTPTVLLLHVNVKNRKRVCDAFPPPFPPQREKSHLAVLVEWLIAHLLLHNQCKYKGLYWKEDESGAWVNPEKTNAKC